MRLVYQATQQEVKKGDIVDLRDGRRARITGMGKPTSPASSGYVYVQELDRSGADIGPDRRCYAPVAGAEWIEREDREGLPDVVIKIIAPVSMRCPRCGGSNTVEVAKWSARSDEDEENEASLSEHQCKACDGASFWL